MTFRVELGNRAVKFLRRADEPLYRRVVDALERLAEDPFPSGAKRIVGRGDKLFRLRVGDHRILYEVMLDEKIVLVVNIDKRSKAYR